MNNNQKLMRLGDIIYAFDSDESFSHLKLTGSSAFQFLIPNMTYVNTDLSFDLHSNLSISELNHLRSHIVSNLPKILQKKNFSLDLKKSKITTYEDMFVVKDDQYKMNFTLRFDYLNRVHILNPEYYARKDEIFLDLHINALSMLENYARYFIEVMYDGMDTTILDEIIKAKKILPQQYPFIRKIMCFYESLQKDFKKHKLDPKYDELFNILTTYSANELEYIKAFEQGLYKPELLLGETLSKSIQKHPKALQIAKSRLKY